MIATSSAHPQISAASGFFGQMFASGGSPATAGLQGAEGVFAALLGQLRALPLGSTLATASEGTGEGDELENIAALLGKNSTEGLEKLSPEMLEALQAALASLQQPQPDQTMTGLTVLDSAAL